MTCMHIRYRVVLRDVRRVPRVEQLEIRVCRDCGHRWQVLGSDPSHLAVREVEGA